MRVRVHMTHAGQVKSVTESVNSCRLVTQQSTDSSKLSRRAGCETWNHHLNHDSCTSQSHCEWHRRVGRKLRGSGQRWISFVWTIQPSTVNGPRGSFRRMSKRSTSRSDFLVVYCAHAGESVCLHYYECTGVAARHAPPPRARWVWPVSLRPELFIGRMALVQERCVWLRAVQAFHRHESAL